MSMGAQGYLILDPSKLFLTQKQKPQTSKEWEISNVIGNDAKMMSKYGLKHHSGTIVGLTFQTSEHEIMGY